MEKEYCYWRNLHEDHRWKQLDFGPGGLPDSEDAAARRAGAACECGKNGDSRKPSQPGRKIPATPPSSKQGQARAFAPLAAGSAHARQADYTRNAALEKNKGKGGLPAFTRIQRHSQRCAKRRLAGLRAI